MTKTVILAVTDGHRPIGFFKRFTGPKKFESPEWTFLVTDAFDFESKEMAQKQVKEFHQKTAAKYYVAEVTFCERSGTLTCPKCGSTDTMFAPKYNPKALCLDCDYSWSPP